MTAEGLYRRALALEASSSEAQEALRKITQTIQVSQRLKAESAPCWPPQLHTFCLLSAAAFIDVILMKCSALSLSDAGIRTTNPPFYYFCPHLLTCLAGVENNPV